MLQQIGFAVEVEIDDAPRKVAQVEADRLVIRALLRQRAP